MSDLNPHAANLLKAEYPAVKAQPTQFAALTTHIAPPSADLIHQLQTAAEEFGIPASAIDWATFLPALIAAISSGNWLTMIPMIVQLVTAYGPQVWAFIQQIIALFHHAPAGGPVITGS